MAKKSTDPKTKSKPAAAKPKPKPKKKATADKATADKSPAASKATSKTGGTTRKKSATGRTPRSKAATSKSSKTPAPAARDRATAAVLDEAVDEQAVSRSLDATTGPLPANKSNGDTHAPVSHPSTAPATDDAGPLTDEQLRKVKTGLKRREMDMLRQLLLEKRADILGDVAAMDRVRHSDSGGDVSHMPLHMADVGSDHYEQEFTLGLVESEQKLLREIDEALGRMRQGIYGVCIVSGEPIPLVRLEIKPWAKYTIEVVRERERRGLD